MLSLRCVKDNKHFIQKQPPGLLWKKCVLENFANFTEKYLCWSFFLFKLQALNLCRSLFLIKSQAHRPPKQVFLRVKFKKFLITPILKNICKRLLLSRIEIRLKMNIMKKYFPLAVFTVKNASGVNIFFVRCTFPGMFSFFPECSWIPFSRLSATISK